MTPHNLSDEQWCVLDLLMRARQKGVDRISRTDLLNSPNIPQGAAMRLTWAALTMPSDLVAWHGEQEFGITPAGVSLYNLRFGKGQAPATPSHIADAVICLPDMSASAH